MDDVGQTENRFFELSERDFDLLKMEINLLEKRITQLEDLQYRLRQFSITLWLASIGFGLGVTVQSANVFLLAVSGIIPALFMYLDAHYAMYAQFLRGRLGAIIQYLNKKDGMLFENIKENLESLNIPTKFPIMDLTGRLTVENDVQTVYRRSIIVKLTRKIRILFYGFQLVGSSIVISTSLVENFNNDLYYLIILSIPSLAAFLFLLRYIKKMKIIKNLPEDYEKILDEYSDNPSFKRTHK